MYSLIIGNPPYISLERLNRRYINEGFYSYAGRADVYCLFYEKALQLVEENGCICFITSNKWLRADYGERLRSLLSKKEHKILKDNLMCFEEARVDANILLLQNKPATIDYITLSKPLIKGTPLSQLPVRMYRGIETGYNKAFVITEEKRKELLDKCPQAEHIIHKLLRGRDVKPFSVKESNLYVIYLHNGTEKEPRININDYPAIKEHIDKYKQFIEKRAHQGDTIYNARPNKNDYFKPKVVFTELSKIPYFTIDSTYLPFSSVNCIEGKDMEYIMAVLSSKTGDELYKKYFACNNLGENTRYKIAYLKNMPIPEADKQTKEYIKSLVYQIIDEKKKGLDTQKKEDEINQIVLELYIE